MGQFLLIKESDHQHRNTGQFLKNLLSNTGGWGSFSLHENLIPVIAAILGVNALVALVVFCACKMGRARHARRMAANQAACGEGCQVSAANVVTPSGHHMDIQVNIGPTL